MQLLHYLLILILPGLIGALAFSIAARFKTEVNPIIALILDLIVLVTMLTGLYLFINLRSLNDLLSDFMSVRFTIKYTLLSSGIALFYGVIIGLIRRMFFWLKR
jgi:hypothetical protein